jgi:hypothetical protein
MLAVSNFFVGAGVLGKAIAHVPIPDVIGQGIGYLAVTARRAVCFCSRRGEWRIARAGSGH